MFKGEAMLHAEEILMSDAVAAERLANLLAETGHRHHEAFAATDGGDPEWPLWYSEYLHGKVDSYLDGQPTRSKIVQCLLNADDAHNADDPDQPWPTFYASYLLGLGADGMKSSDHPHHS
jgi:NAD(P)H-hydrate epimerase